MLFWSSLCASYIVNPSPVEGKSSNVRCSTVYKPRLSSSSFLTISIDFLHSSVACSSYTSKRSCLRLNFRQPWSAASLACCSLSNRELSKNARSRDPLSCSSNFRWSSLHFCIAFTLSVFSLAKESFTSLLSFTSTSNWDLRAWASFRRVSVSICNFLTETVKPPLSSVVFPAKDSFNCGSFLLCFFCACCEAWTELLSPLASLVLSKFSFPRDEGKLLKDLFSVKLLFFPFTSLPVNDFDATCWLPHCRISFSSLFS